MKRISEATIQEVNNRADALSVIGEYVRLTKKGGRYWGLCPFHNEKSPSFSVDPDQKFFYCFGCSKGGGVVNFIMELEKLSFPEAIEQLAGQLGIEMHYDGSGVDPVKDDGKKARLESMGELYSRVAGSFHHILTSTTQGLYSREYLGSRAITQETIERFKLGYAPADRSWLFTFLSGKGYSPSFLAESGLFSAKYPKSAFFSDRLIFPISDRRGNTIAFGGRILHGEGPKYLNSAESELFRKKENLFALDLALPAIRQSKTAYICEGYMDVIALHQAGVVNAVAPLGTAFTEDQAKLLRRWCEKIYLVFDSDEAGRNAAVKGILTCRKIGLNCSVVAIQGGKDPADILKDAGPEALQKGVECYISELDYLVDRARNLFDINESEGKVKSVAFLFPYLETLDSEVLRDASVGKIADAFGVERAAVYHDFANRPDQGRSHREEQVTGEAKTAPSAPVKMNDELFLLMTVVANRNLYRTLRASFSPEDIGDIHAKELFIALEECFRGESSDIDGLMSRITDEELRRFVLAQSASNAFRINPERILEDGIIRIKQKRFDQRRSEILMQMRIARSTEMDKKKLDDLLIEKMHIDTELARLKDAH